MKIEYTFLFCLVVILGSSCNDAPEFPNTPKIEFESILFKDVGNGDADSLIINISFEDGDGDLGLDAQEIASPFNQKNYFSNKTGRFFSFGTETIDDLLKFSNSSEIDSLPTYEGDAICLFWDTNPDIFFEDGTQLDDTVYFQFNQRHHNILVDYFVDRGSGFEEFDWLLDLDCSTDFNGRFPILNLEDGERALEGTIRYGMPSVGFRNIFGEDQIKLSITILDRGGNFSNTIETPPFRLSEID